MAFYFHLFLRTAVRTYVCTEVQLRNRTGCTCRLSSTYEAHCKAWTIKKKPGTTTPVDLISQARRAAARHLSLSLSLLSPSTHSVPTRHSSSVLRMYSLPDQLQPFPSRFSIDTRYAYVNCLRSTGSKLNSICTASAYGPSYVESAGSKTRKFQPQNRFVHVQHNRGHI